VCAVRFLNLLHFTLTNLAMHVRAAWVDAKGARDTSVEIEIDAANSPVDGWRVQARGQQFAPALYDARADGRVWVVCRPADEFRDGAVLRVGALELLACSAVVVVLAEGREDHRDDVALTYDAELRAIDLEGALPANLGATRVVVAEPLGRRAGEPASPDSPDDADEPAEATEPMSSEYEDDDDDEPDDDTIEDCLETEEAEEEEEEEEEEDHDDDGDESGDEPDEPPDDASQDDDHTLPDEDEDVVDDPELETLDADLPEDDDDDDL